VAHATFTELVSSGGHSWRPFGDAIGCREAPLSRSAADVARTRLQVAVDIDVLDNDGDPDGDSLAVELGPSPPQAMDPGGTIHGASVQLL
jgi:hypothetical protein